MSADFNAGSIEGSLDLDTSPFRRGLEWAKAEAKKFTGNDIKPNLGLETGKFKAEKDKAKVQLDDLGKKKAEPEVKLKGVGGVLAGLGLVQHEMKKTEHGGGSGGMMTGLLLKIGLLGPALLSVVAAAGPATAALVAFGAAAGVALGGAVLSLGLFAASVKSALTPILKANKAGKELSGWAGKVQHSLKGLTGGWQALQKTVRPQMFQFLNTAFSGLAGVLPKLAPLLKTTTSGMTSVVKSVLAVTKTPLFGKFLKDLQTFMGGFLNGLGPVLANALKTFMHLFSALRPVMKMLGAGIESASKAVEKFSKNLDHGGIDPFIGKIKKFLPLLGKLVSDLVKGLGHIGKGLAPLAGPALKAIDAIVRAIGNINFAPLAKGIGDLLNSLRPLLPLVSHLISKGFAILGPALTKVGQALKFVETHQGAIAVLLGLGTIVGIIKAVALAQKAWNVVLAATNVLMRMNPIGLVITLLAGLAVGLIYAYKHSKTFRDIVNAAFTDVKKVVSNVVGWFQHSFVPFFTKTIPGAFQSVLSWLKHNWPYILGILTGPIGMAVVLIIKHWKDIEGAFSTAVHWVGSVFKAGWNKIEDWIIHPVENAAHELGNILGKIKDGFQNAISAIGRIWDGLTNALSKPIHSALGWISDHFAKPINSLLSKVGLHISLPTFSAGGQVPGYADGGLLHGPWHGPTADNMIIRANPREFVEPVSAVDYYGPGLFEALRTRSIPKEALPRFGLGGLIGKVWSGAKSAWGGVSHAATSILSSVNPAHIFETLANKLLGGFEDNIWGQTVGAVAKKTVGALADKVKSFVGSIFSGGGGKGGAPSGAYSGSYGVGRWAGLASHVLSMLGQSQAWLPTLLHRMNVESGGNPRAINLWDSNAAAGHPSKGLMQTIDGTFNAYAGKYRGLGVWNPLANIYAAVRYALARYGVPAVGGTAGYANGGVTTRAHMAMVGDNPGAHEAIIPLDKYDIPRKGDNARAEAASRAHSAQQLAVMREMVNLLRGILGKDDIDRLAESLGKHSDATMRQMLQVARAY